MYRPIGSVLFLGLTTADARSRSGAAPRTIKADNSTTSGGSWRARWLPNRASGGSPNPAGMTSGTGGKSPIGNAGMGGGLVNGSGGHTAGTGGMTGAGSGGKAAVAAK